jgi:hypothetical protein
METALGILGLVVLPAAFVFGHRIYYSVRAPRVWHSYFRIIPKSVLLIDGTTTRSLYLMRVMGADDKWVFRRMTKKEFQEIWDVPP